MSYAALLVHCDRVQGCADRVRLASDLAARFDAALIGSAGWSFQPSFALDDTTGTGDLRERDWQLDRLAEIEKTFHASVQRLELAHVEWRGAVDSPSELVPREARAADLVIIGPQRDPSDLFFSLNPGAMILRAGRPVLFVPDAIDLLQGRRIVVCWKNTREARRAIADALPFLREADHVTIASVSEIGTEEQIRNEIEHVTTYLLSHEVNVSAKAYLHTEQSIAAELLRFSKEQEADLIVTGGYGHSRLGEWVFGGVTNGLLADSAVSCLFSH